MSLDGIFFLIMSNTFNEYIEIADNIVCYSLEYNKSVMDQTLCNIKYKMFNSCFPP